MNGPHIERRGPGRLRLTHGPIDVFIDLWGESRAIEAGFGRAADRFGSILDELVAELPGLRQPVTARSMFAGVIARRMLDACRPFAPAFITPMAAVAGAVAEEVLASIRAADDGGIERACVNNGGDIAIHLSPGTALDLAIVSNPTRPQADALARIDATQAIRGIATSGWRGRSFSLGIADGVTVFGANAAVADAAATMIANAVNLAGDARIARRPANTLRDDTDLGALPVTVGVAELDEASIARALEGGVQEASRCLARGLIAGAGLFLQSRFRAVGPAVPLRITPSG